MCIYGTYKRQNVKNHSIENLNRFNTTRLCLNQEEGTRIGTQIGDKSLSYVKKLEYHKSYTNIWKKKTLT